jgi:hypothetical protein
MTPLPLLPFKPRTIAISILVIALILGGVFTVTAYWHQHNKLQAQAAQNATLTHQLQRAVLAENADRLEARVATCNAFNDAQDAEIAWDRVQFSVAVAHSRIPISAADKKKYDALIVKYHPKRDCTVAGIKKFYAAEG